MNDVTIIICNYNYERFLADAIDSALAQDYAATRVVVIDDGSTDGSREVIGRFGSRISAVFKENGGQVSAYNRAVEVLETKYAILLDSDDVLYPSAVSEVMRAFDGELVGKVGADASYAIGVRNSGTPTGTHGTLGIAVKVEDGNTAVLYAIVAHVLEQLSIGNETQREKLAAYRNPPMRNTMGIETGRLVVSVPLERV